MSLGKNILKILTSRVAVQVITIATAPILSRIIDPGAFGIRQAFTSIFAVLAVICCLRYELSIPLGRDRKEAVSSFLLSVFLTFIFSAAALAGVVFLKDDVVRWFKMPELEVFLWLLPLFVLIKGVGLAMRYWAGYEKRFGAIAWASVGAALGQKPVSLLWALFFGGTVTALFIGSFGQIAVMLVVFAFLVGRGLIREIKSGEVNFGSVLSAAKRHKKFPIFNSWGALFNTLSRQLPVFILGFYFPEDVVGYSVLGYYFWAINVVSLPVRLVGQSVSQVFYPTAAKEYNETGRLNKVVEQIFKRLVQIGIFPMVVLVFLGGELFGVVLGERLTEAGVYAQILAPWLLFNFLSSPLGVFNILNRQGTALVFTIAAIIGRAAALVIGGMYFSPRIGLGLFAGFSALHSIVGILYRMRLSKVSLFWAGEKIVKYIVVCSILVLPVKLLSYLVADWVVVPAAVVVSVAYLAVLLKADASLRRFILNILGRLETGKSSIEKE